MSIKKAQIERDNLFSLSDIGRIVGATTQQVWMLVYGGFIPKPSELFGKRRYYLQSEVGNIVAQVKQLLKK